MAESGSAEPQPRLDGLGVFWIVFALSWTLVVAGGMTYLYRRRDMPMLRIRGLPLSFSAIVLLHLYWGAVQTGYCYGPIWPSWVEFWIMNIWLPFGIALFHASNSRFLHVANSQKKRFAEEQDMKPLKIDRPKPTTLLGRFRALDYTRKVLFLVGTGMAFQVRRPVYYFRITLTIAAFPYRFHVSCLAKVPPLLWYPGN